jgi:ATP-binding cassette subfamily B protein
VGVSEGETDAATTDPIEIEAQARRRRKSVRSLPRLLRSAISLVWQADRRAFILSWSLQLVSGLVTAVQVYFVTKVVAALLRSQTGAPVTDAIAPIVALAALITYGGIADIIVRQQQRLLAELAERLTKARILDVAGAVDLWAYETSDFYDRLRRVETSAATRPYFLTTGLITFVGGAAGAISLAIAVVVIQPLLLPLIVLAGVPLWLTGRRVSRREFEFAVAQTPTQRMRDYLDTTLTGRSEAKELRAFGAVPTLRRRYDEVYDTFVAALRVHVRAKQRLGVVGAASSGSLLIITFVVLIWLVQHHHVTLSEVAGAVVGIRMLSGQINALMVGAQQIFESSLFLQDLDEFLTEKPVRRAVTRGRHALPAARVPQRPAPHGFATLQVDRVSFAYPGSGREALDEVSMTLRQGQVVALVGENGSGKTTLAKLLAGLYEPDAGAITWDGVDVEEFEPASMHDSIAVIFQDFVRYQLTARENVTLGRPDRLDAAALDKAVAGAGARDIISALPAGYDTILSKQFKGGEDLSLGQWQRIALARAFYRDAPFIILDEPSASLDPRAEADLFEKMQTLLRGRTVLLISHRFSSVRYADHIYVLRAGRVVEDGSHAELMRSGGLYADLFSLQAAAYIDRAEVD